MAFGLGLENTILLFECFELSGTLGDHVLQGKTIKEKLKEQTAKQRVRCVLYSVWPTRISSKKKKKKEAPNGFHGVLIGIIGWFPEQTVNSVLS